MAKLKLFLRVFWIEINVYSWEYSHEYSLLPGITVAVCLVKSIKSPQWEGWAVVAVQGEVGRMVDRWVGFRPGNP